MTLAPGARLGGRYQLADLIAAGGMGDVWRATDTVLGRPVAVKVLRVPASQEGEFAARFRDEARHAAGLTHPNIAAVYDYGEDDGTAYLVMELVPGRPLSELIAEGPMPQAQVRSILGQGALALAAAHAAGVVHRDVKPANILVTDEGRVKLTDFGIARAGDAARHTRTGEVMGTPQYLAPEQAMGRTVSGATDLYSLGVVGFEMLAGARPFDAGSPVATALAHISEPPPPLPAHVTDPLRAAIESCLAKDPAQRPSSAASLAALLGMPVSGVAHASLATSVIPLTELGPTQAMPGPELPYGGPGLDATEVVRQPFPTAGTTQPGGPAYLGDDDDAAYQRDPAYPAYSAYGDAGDDWSDGRAPRRRGSAGWWWLLPVLVALAAGYVLWQQLSPGAATPSTTVPVTSTRTAATTTSRPPTTSSAPTSSVASVQIVESDYLGQTAGIVRSDLTLLGFTTIVTVQEHSDQPTGQVIKVSPTGLLPVTTKLTITISSGPTAPPTTGSTGPGTTGGSGG